MKSNTYKIADKKILFYGAGTTAISILNRIKTINLYGFIDKRANMFNAYKGTPVFLIGDLDNWDDKDSFVIIITIKNVFEHFQIANELFEKGYTNIIFKPLTILKNIQNDELISISEAHDCFFVNFEMCTKEIRSYTNCDSILPSDKAVFEKEEDYIKANIPSRLIFTNSTANKEFNEINFVSNFISVDLYASFMKSDFKSQESIQKYINEYAIVAAKKSETNTEGDWENMLIDSRMKTYYEMDSIFSLSFDFFRKNCASVNFCKNGRFVLSSSGKSRVAFLIAKSLKYIPVKISIQDYESYINDKKLNSLLKYIQKNNIKQLFAPIPHPYFYEYPVIAPDYDAICVARVSKYFASFFSKNDISEISVVDMLEDEGSLSRHLSLLGYNVYRDSTESKLLHSHIDDLLYTKINMCDRQKRFEVSLITNETPVEVIENTNQVIFIISQNEIPSKIQDSLKINGFNFSECLFHTIWNYRKIQGIIFIKRG